MRIKIPALSLQAKYTSTGVLIVIPANGNGAFHAELGKSYLKNQNIPFTAEDTCFCATLTWIIPKCCHFCFFVGGLTLTFTCTMPLGMRSM